MQYQPQQASDGRQSVSGSQTLLATNTAVTGAGTTGTTGTTATTSTGPGDVVISIDEKQPLICRPDHILTIDTVSETRLHVAWSVCLSVCW